MLFFNKKHIDTDSVKYKRFKTIGYWSAVTGGLLAFDCLTVPYLYVVFGFKKRYLPLRLLGYLGIANLSTVAGLMSGKIFDSAVDGLVQLHNKEFIGEDPGETQYTYPDNSVKDMTPEEELNCVNELVERSKLFEFDNEDEAKALVERIHTLFGSYELLTLLDIYHIRAQNGVEYSGEDRNLFYALGWKFGWSSDNRPRGVETVDVEGEPTEPQTTKRIYVVDARNYVDISDKIHS